MSNCAGSRRLGSDAAELAWAGRQEELLCVVRRSVPGSRFRGQAFLQTEEESR